MTAADLVPLLRKQFPDARMPESAEALVVGSFAEWDSLGHLNFLLLVEEHFDTRFSMDEMSEFKSLADIAAALTAKDAGDR